MKRMIDWLVVITLHRIGDIIVLQSLENRLRGDGWLTRPEVAKELGVHPSTVSVWSKHQLLDSKLCNSFSVRLYKLKSETKPYKKQGQKLTDRSISTHLPTQVGGKA